MKLGIATVITDEGIRPDVLATVLEDRGFDSLVVAEHSHIPASRATLYPAGDELPREFLRSYDPFVALTAAALATSKLLIGSGVLLLSQRDSIQTAKAVSSLDQISGGRLLLGLGQGWNLEEAAHYGVEATMRGKLLDEKLDAMKELWANDRAEFHGRHVDFGATYCWPKPVQKPHPPIYFGGFTAAAVARARRHRAGWMPVAVPVPAMVPGQLSLLDGATDIPVSVIVPERVDRAVLDAYRRHGVERAFIMLSTKPEKETLQLLDSIAAFTEMYGWAG
jgi:probable F420-dependent oxidoreductase